MSANLTLMGVAAILIATGVYLMMERSVTRVLVGVLLAGNGVNIVFLVASGPAGQAPFIGLNQREAISDPLPQAMVLTAIVITLGLTAFLLTMAYRSFQLHGHDEVQDDVEDSRIRELAEYDLVSASFDEDDHSMPSEDDSEPVPEEGRDDADADDDLGDGDLGGDDSGQDPDGDDVGDDGEDPEPGVGTDVPAGSAGGEGR